MTHEEIEGAVIGALLLRNLDAYPQTFDVFSTLPVEAFGTRQYRDIYREIMRQALSKNVIDPVLVGEALGGEYQAIMSASVKLSWAIANLEQYASLVVKNHFIRSAEEVVANAITALDGARTGDESMTAIAELRDSLQHMELNSGELVAVHINDLLAGVETRLEERMAGVGEGRTLLTGIDELDALTGGFDLTDLVLIAARPSVGKTEFALNLIDKITELGGGVLLFSMEMSGIQIAERQVAGAGGLSTSKLKSPGQLEDEDWARISAGIGRMVNRPIWIIDASELTVEQIKQSAIAHKRTVMGKIKASSEYVKSVKTATDGSEVPVAILVDNVDTTTATQRGGVYLMGQFNQNSVIHDASWTLAELKTALHSYSIFLEDSIQAPV
ncbi:TPA: DnaB-like helicase C-terminal domain-containing protein [Yersinia enterocolitica]